MKPISILTLAAIAYAVTACGSQSGSPDQGTADNAAVDTAEDGGMDVPVNDDLPADVGMDTGLDSATDVSVPDQSVDQAVTDLTTDDSPVDSADSTEPGDFAIRVPNQSDLECQPEFEGAETYYLAELDYVCRIETTGLTADLYVRTSPSDCGQFGNPSHTVDSAWIKMNGDISTVTATYDFGGRHHNDIITFETGGNIYKIAHSSIGWGWRACHFPDCLVVCSGLDGCTTDGSSVTSNGCVREVGGPAPAAPVICVAVNPDGTVPEMTDPWNTRSEYGDYNILPCGGDMGPGTF